MQPLPDPLKTHFGILADSELFSEDAILISVDGNVYTGTVEIETYYDGWWRNLAEYYPRQEIMSIQIEDGSARASYCFKSSERFAHETIPHVKTFSDNFLLIEKDGDWKIVGLTVERDNCWRARELFIPRT